MSEDTISAAQKIAEGHEELEKANAAQLHDMLDTHRSETLAIFTEAMRTVLTSGDEATKKLLIQKIPLLCTDILQMKGDIKTQTLDIALIKKFGGYILLGIGMLFLTLVGSLLLKNIPMA